MLVTFWNPCCMKVVGWTPDAFLFHSRGKNDLSTEAAGGQAMANTMVFQRAHFFYEPQYFDS